MFRTDRSVPVPGRPIPVEVLTDAGPALLDVGPITGAMELDVAAARSRARTVPPVLLETLVLASGAVEWNGAALQAETAEALLLGDRARLTLAVLCAGYGAPSELLWTCPDCGTMQELPFDPQPILETRATGPVGQGFPSAHGLSMRLPIGADLSVLAAEGRASAAALLSRCAPEAGVGDIEAVEAEISARDPCAEIALAAHCIACGQAGNGVIDPLALLRAEMDREGGILAEIDAIARAYHWSEAELRALPAHQRRLYLAAIRASEAEEPSRWAS
ncbi:hypothetical protein [Tropicimonas sp. IMCC34043]|uniref:hypothetical protein n=1 Tax=Tropicimonas sp. IMCC34043 TaxID=2248760 RepID=UPI00130064BC|nr:hypothetical protein [Tropicimonas sp. IMCC34043]